jgi:deoxyribodipyrimidine photolyase-related protein
MGGLLGVRGLLLRALPPPTPIALIRAGDHVSPQPRLRLILGDQLNAGHSWFRQTDDQCLYLIAELKQETGYVKHHVQKICAFFAAMQSFATALQQAGHRVLYLTLDDTADAADLPALMRRIIAEHGIRLFEFQRPDEYRLLEQLRAFAASLDIPVHECDSEHFLLPFDEIGRHFKPGKAHRMEMFYRRMRKRYDLLMTDGEPIGGQWNFDRDNREPLTPEAIAQLPAPLSFSNDVSAILARLERHGIEHFGRPMPTLLWPVTRRQARDLLTFFCAELLPRFGRFQDAMTAVGDARWSLYHSRLSFALNSKMLHPKQVLDAALNAWQQDPQRISLAQIEGFVRQILGWREFVRGLYWANMPGYATRNALEAQRPLPAFFWNGQTRMRCLRESLGQSLDYAYAHHIQRLMVIGNFALLAGLDPDAVDNWYLGVYVDAIEWVELPNTRGMSQFADGGLLASKPYAASGQYIDRMSDYCNGCRYRIRERSTEHACPFNSLYWHFLQRHRARFESNPRMALVYKNWDRQTEESRRALLARADWCLNHLDQL